MPPSRNLGVDVTLSVWNSFFSEEQIQGFKSSQMTVRLLTNRRCCSSPDSLSMAWVSWLYLRLFFKTKKQVFRRLSIHAFDLEAGSNPLNTKVLWAYVTSSSRLMTKAKRLRIPIILDVPIAHMRRYHEVMIPEFAKYGLPYTEPNWAHWVQKCEAAYLTADWLSVGSRFVKETLVNRGVRPERILINPYGIDGSHWSKCHEAAQRDANKMIFIFTASVTLRKGIQYLLEAWRIAGIKNAELRIVGGGTLPWEKLAGGSLPTSVTMVGRLNHKQLQDEYTRAHVYVLPSLQEGLARSGLEAMAAGLAMVVTPETGLTDFVEDGKHGWIVKSRDADALAKRLAWCVSHKDSVSAAQQAAFEAAKHFRFSAYGLRCARIAKAVIEGRQPPTI